MSRCANSGVAGEVDRPTRVRWLIFAVACAVSWLLYVHRYAWGVIKPEFRAEFPHLSDIDVGWLDSAFMAAYALGQVPSGLAGDWLGPRGLLASMILVWSAAAAGIAWTGGLFWRVFGCRAAFGLAQAGGYPIVSRMTRNWFPLVRRTTAQGVITAMGRFGAACASPIIATALMGWCGLDWRTALYVIAVPGVLLAVLVALWARDSPRQHPWANAAECQLIDEGAVSSPAASRQPRLARDHRAYLSLGMLLLYAFASTFQDQLYVNLIPEFLRVGRSLDPVTMGFFAPLPLIGGAVGAIIGGVLNDILIRAGVGRRWARSLVGLTGKALAGVLVGLSVFVPDGRLAMVVLLTARLFSDWSLPTQWGAITDMGGRAAATLFALVNTIGAVGGFAAGPILGWLRQNYDWTGLFFGTAAMCLAAGLTWLFIDCTKKVLDD
ncbi:MAG: MFS transporter [Gemmataceae bacterium]|nr:MFS transporter [Gemmataceae bacterium]